MIAKLITISLLITACGSASDDSSTSSTESARALTPVVSHHIVSPDIPLFIDYFGLGSDKDFTPAQIKTLGFSVATATKLADAPSFNLSVFFGDTIISMMPYGGDNPNLGGLLVGCRRTAGHYNVQCCFFYPGDPLVCKYEPKL